MPTSAPPTINGVAGAHEQPMRYGWNESGQYVIRTWIGTLAAVEAQIPWVQFSGGLYEVSRGIGVHKLEARFSIPAAGQGPEQPVDTWEFFASHSEKDVLECDKAIIDAIPEDEKRKIRDAIANPVPGKSPALTDTNAIDLYLLMLSGLRAVRVNVPTLRHTQTVSNQYAVKAALTNVGKIITTATLALFENIPNDVLFNLPTDGSTRTGLTYAWFKLHPTIRRAARQKMQIELEYEYGLWSTLLYGAAL